MSTKKGNYMLQIVFAFILLCACAWALDTEMKVEDGKSTSTADAAILAVVKAYRADDVATTLDAMEAVDALKDEEKAEIAEELAVMDIRMENKTGSATLAIEKGEKFLADYPASKHAKNVHYLLGMYYRNNHFNSGLQPEKSPDYAALTAHWDAFLAATAFMNGTITAHPDKYRRITIQTLRGNSEQAGKEAKEFLTATPAAREKGTEFVDSAVAQMTADAYVSGAKSVDAATADVAVAYLGTKDTKLAEAIGDKVASEDAKREKDASEALLKAK